MAEWDDEPDKVEFEHCGLKCFLSRGPMGSLNGYVELPQDSTAYGLDLQWEGPFEVHGGVTFNGTFKEVTGEEDLYVVGFDTGHAWDISPRYPRDFAGSGATYKNLAFVTEQAKSLAEQVASTRPQPAYEELFDG